MPKQSLGLLWHKHCILHISSLQGQQFTQQVCELCRQRCDLEQNIFTAPKGQGNIQRPGVCALWLLTQQRWTMAGRSWTHTVSNPKGLRCSQSRNTQLSLGPSGHCVPLERNPDRKQLHMKFYARTSTLDLRIIDKYINFLISHGNINNVTSV